MESTGRVRFSPPRAAAKVWEHAFDFLAYVTTELCDAPTEEATEKPGPGKWVKWRTLILRRWAVDPEVCHRGATGR
ncbi:hypothetical protein IV102_37180 [bacterium]|nr:hypothetical protein [bacterium]